MFGSWRDITRFSLASLAAMAGLQAATLACVWALQHVALRADRWRPVITSQLAGGALAKIAPGGGAMGAALQYRMLVRSGLPPAATVTALTAVNVLVFAVVLAMPVLAIPALLRGGVNRTLLDTALVGLAIFAVAFVLGAVLLTTDRPLAWVGRAAQRVRNRLRRGAEPLHHLPERLLRERDRLVGTLGPRWKRALLATVGRWTFDYLTLLAALAAIGSHPRPGARPARVLRRPGAGPDPGHAGRAGVRRGRADRDARARRRERRRRRAGDVRLPAVLVLAAAAARAARLRAAAARAPSAAGAG